MANLSVDTFQLTKSKNEGKTPLLKLAITSPWQAETLASPVESPQIDVKNLVASPSEDMLNGDSESESSKSRGSSPTRKPNPSKNQSFIEKFKFKKSKANTKTLEIPMSQQTESMISVSSQASTTAERLPPLPSTVSRQIVDEYVTLQ